MASLTLRLAPGRGRRSSRAGMLPVLWCHLCLLFWMHRRFPSTSSAAAPRLAFVSVQQRRGDNGDGTIPTRRPAASSAANAAPVSPRGSNVPPPSPTTAVVVVAGLECRPVTVPLTFPTCGDGDDPVIGSAGFVTVLEATAKAQDALVDLVLLEEENSSTGVGPGIVEVSTIGTRQGDIYGSVLWPAASCVASYLLEHNAVRGKSVLELGTGTGLVSLACWCLGGAVSVVATDYEELPLCLLEHAATHLNQPASTTTGSEGDKGGIQTGLRTGLFDVRNFSDELPEADVVVAADVLYEPVTGRALAQRVVQALRRGSRVVIGDSPGRAGRPAFLEDLRRCGVPNATFRTVRGWTVTGERHELICGKGSTSRTPIMQELAIAVLDLDPSQYTRVS